MNKKVIAGLISLAFHHSISATENINLDEVVVTATRTPQKTNEALADISVIDAEEIKNSGQTSLVDLLATQPGIQISNGGGMGKSSSIFIRGANATGTLVLIDGMRISSATSGTTSLENIPLSQIERVEILRGPASSLYGSDAIGGVIQIITKSTAGAPRFNASVGLGTYDTVIADAGVSGRISDTSFSLQAGVVRTDGISAIANSTLENFNPDNDGYHNKNLSLKLAQHFGKNHEVGITGFLSEGENHFDGGKRTPLANPTNKFDFYGTQTLSSFDIYSKNQLSKNWFSTLRAGQSEDDSNSYAPNNTNTLSIKSVFKTTQTQYMWQNDIVTPIGRVILGTERREQKVDSTTAYAMTKQDIQSFFAGWQGNYNAHSMQFNARNDDNSQFGNKTTGAISYAYQFTTEWRAGASFGTAFNAPTFNQLYFPNFGNPNLAPEEARNKEVSVHYDNGTHKVGAVYYHNKVSDLIVNTGKPLRPQNVSEALLSGLTLTYQGSVAGLNVAANADFTKPEDEATGNLLPRRSKNHGTLSVSKKWNDWELGSMVETHSKRYDEAANTIKLDGYTLMNIYANYHINNQWSLTARVNNIFDRQYETINDYGALGSNAFFSMRYVSAP